MRLGGVGSKPKPSGGGSDKEIRERLLAIWKKMGSDALKAHCGGMGLVVGCPICGKRWNKR